MTSTKKDADEQIVLREYITHKIIVDIDELANLGAYEELWSIWDHVLSRMPAVTPSITEEVAIDA